MRYLTNQPTGRSIRPTASLLIQYKMQKGLALMYMAGLMSSSFDEPLTLTAIAAANANGEYHPRKHTKQSYRAQQRAAKKRRKS